MNRHGLDPLTLEVAHVLTSHFGDRIALDLFATVVDLVAEALVMTAEDALAEQMEG